MIRVIRKEKIQNHPDDSMIQNRIRNVLKELDVTLSIVQKYQKMNNKEVEDVEVEEEVKRSRRCRPRRRRKQDVEVEEKKTKSRRCRARKKQTSRNVKQDVEEQRQVDVEHEEEQKQFNRRYRGRRRVSRSSKSCSNSYRSLVY